MLKVLTSEAPKDYKKLKPETKWSKIIYDYVQLKRFHNYQRLQVHMYDLMYVGPEIIPVEDNLTDTKK